MDAKTLCLGVLTLGDATGYEIKKQFEEGPFAYFHAVGFGSIYPALAKLGDEGLVTCTEQAQDGRPDKKVYSITEAGREVFVKAIHQPPGEDKIRSDTCFVLFFAHLLKEGHRDAVFDGYLEAYRSMIEEMSCEDIARESPGRRFVHGFGLSIYEAVVEYMENNRSLLAEEWDGGEQKR